MKTAFFLTQFLRIFGRCFLIGLLVSLGAMPSFALPQPDEWIRQLGTSGNEFSYSVAVDGLGNVYITGGTDGDLGGDSAGSSDAFVSKYDASGSLQWIKQFGSSGYDVSYDISVDVLGNIYVSGTAGGSFGGSSHAGAEDMFLNKYDTSGTLCWTQQMGTGTSDTSYSVSPDNLGNVYIAGTTRGSLGCPNLGGEDLLLCKYKDSGELCWIKQWGSSDYDLSWDTATDSLGNIYVSGYTQGTLPGESSAGGIDAFLSKFNGKGELLWTEQFGTDSEDGNFGVSVDGLGNVYVSGVTDGNLGGTNQGAYDAYVRKYDTSGTLLWTEQLGTANEDGSYDVSADGLGNVYITGITEGSLGGPNIGSLDVFISKYNDMGELLWTEQFGTDTVDYCQSLVADGSGNIYFSGYTYGTFGGNSHGNLDAFVGKISDVPEPSTLLMVVLGLVTLSVFWRR